MHVFPAFSNSNHARIPGEGEEWATSDPLLRTFWCISSYVLLVKGRPSGVSVCKKWLERSRSSIASPEF